MNLMLLLLSLLIFGVLAEKEKIEDGGTQAITEKLWHEIKKRIGELNLDGEDISQETNMIKDSSDKCFFDKNENYILMTHDSIENGAEFILSPHVHLGDECINTCCVEENCNVAVFKEKEETACYLFNCGANMQLCNFTAHPGFSVTKLPKKKVKTKSIHEADLAKLVKTTTTTVSTTTTSTTTTTPKPTTTTTTTTLPPPTTKAVNNKSPVQLFGKCENNQGCAGANTECLAGYCVCQDGYHSQDNECRKDCSRFEFECANEGQPLAYPQCIAIYDTCDGVGHCSDQSDERNCPKNQPAELRGRIRQHYPTDLQHTDEGMRHRYPGDIQHASGTRHQYPGDSQQEDDLRQQYSPDIEHTGDIRQHYPEDTQHQDADVQQGYPAPLQHHVSEADMPAQQQASYYDLQRQQVDYPQMHPQQQAASLQSPPQSAEQHGPVNLGLKHDKVKAQVRQPLGHRYRLDPNRSHGYAESVSPKTAVRPALQPNSKKHPPTPATHALEKQRSKQVEMGDGAISLEDSHDKTRLVNINKPLKPNPPELKQIETTTEMTSSVSRSKQPSHVENGLQHQADVMPVGEHPVMPDDNGKYQYVSGAGESPNSKQQPLENTNTNYPHHTRQKGLPNGMGYDNGLYRNQDLGYAEKYPYFRNIPEQSPPREYYSDSGYIKSRPKPLPVDNTVLQNPDASRNRLYGYNRGDYENGPYQAVNPSYDHYYDDESGPYGMLGTDGQHDYVYHNDAEILKPEKETTENEIVRPEPTKHKATTSPKEEQSSSTVSHQEPKNKIPDLQTPKPTKLPVEEKKPEDSTPVVVEKSKPVISEPKAATKKPDNHSDDNTENVNSSVIIKPVENVAMEANVQEEAQKNSIIQSNQGAVIALALGLTVTALLLVFVGCRLRNMKRRLRRGRPLDSNEADYLINGMYL